jgi:hypothetical protein
MTLGISGITVRRQSQAFFDSIGHIQTSDKEKPRRIGPGLGCVRELRAQAATSASVI